MWRVFLILSRLDSLCNTWLPGGFFHLVAGLGWALFSHSRKSLYLTFLWQQLGTQVRWFLLSWVFRPFSFFPLSLSLHPPPLICVGAQADRSAGRLTGSMMELQTLQEALKVEIQIHQVCSISRPLGQWVRRRLASTAAEMPDVWRGTSTRKDSSRPWKGSGNGASANLNISSAARKFQTFFLSFPLY